MASGMFRRGLRLSPPSCTACSNPEHAKITPPDDRARNTPFHPNGMNPPAAEKFPVWKAVTRRTITVSTGMKIFHQTIVLFDCESQRTPITLIAENSSISTAATT